MGMAASQARYLALTARKTNTEYEGQQINQARTALANQSANLFNRLLDLKVPTAPSTTDYTKVQYSYSDGNNASVIDDWQQLSSADPNYNYIVKHYYNANVYTGSQKLLNDPQIKLKADVVKPAPEIQIKPNGSGGYTLLVDGQETRINYLPMSAYDGDTDLNNSLKDLEENGIIQSMFGSKDLNDLCAYRDSNNVWHFMLKSEIESEGTNIKAKDYYTQYIPESIGNCKLTEITEEFLETAPDSKAIVAELAQIRKDCPESSMKDYIDIDGGNLSLKINGGVYQFQMNGQTYYTTLKDLNNSMETSLNYGKPIDNQEKLAYYNASYIETRIEETNKALLETDGTGRFKSVKFDDDSVVYTLNTETVTDDAAYQDAMNKYTHDVAVYEKTIADINAKTSIIQQEDRTLELRLKQLDTEQLALKTEMDAVKSVIKENVEKTFKTFGD